MALFFEDGSFVLSALGKGGAWEEVDFTEGGSGMLLKPDAGGQIFLEERPWGYLSDAIRLVRTSAEFAGFWHDFEPSSPLYLPLTRQGWRITSPYGNMDSIANGETWDAVISGENAQVSVEGDRMRWAFGNRWGYARRFIGTPQVDHPMALLVPHFYDYWCRLGTWRPARRKAIPGISFLASNLGTPGSLAARRLEIAGELSRWFTVAIPPRLAGLFPSDAKLRLVEVPRAPRAKLEFLSQFTFNLCFENSQAPGYLTEKPFDALMSGAVPIYEGDPGVSQWIHPTALIQCSGLNSGEIADQVRQAELDGTVERVHEERGHLITVSLEEMIQRVSDFCDNTA